ncbi:hypothetical protein K505DRAFT_414223 [Melanomma pulvis-pyrius CBS 109.77]|uniref:Uncharacterized protein n=1 Tax=Melanomma pulvis-pyrius CBS 109.77 TaxID=1314802 RepID=A0A6A6XQH7_9PLEO|nr:hypothetical protein K505DRAFT_414223 [Melanomma pulvis-pyrius CBS 109.77]
MPRQLPWLSSSSGTKTQVKTSAKAAGKGRRRGFDSDDDDFFAGTVLDSPRIEKERADPRKSDDELPELLTLADRKGKKRIDRAPSSSPPPISNLAPPRIEFMHKGVNRSDLRDDEWRMVEDEFLATAKLFTQHAHLADYERWKESKSTKTVILRPVVPTASPSVEASFHQKAKAQAKAQRKALDDVGKYDFATPSRASSTKLPSSAVLGRSKSGSAVSSEPVDSSVSRVSYKDPAPRRKAHFSESSDGDDLDAPQRPAQSRPASTSHTFIKPALPSKAGTARQRPVRATSFDFLDDPPPTKSSYSSAHQPSTSKYSQTSASKPKRSLDLLDDFDDFPKRTTLPKEQTDRRLAKRRADQKKEGEREKRKSVKLDDIPTFLF